MRVPQELGLARREGGAVGLELLEERDQVAGGFGVAVHLHELVAVGLEAARGVEPLLRDHDRGHLGEDFEAAVLAERLVPAGGHAGLDVQPLQAAGREVVDHLGRAVEVGDPAVQVVGRVRGAEALEGGRPPEAGQRLVGRHDLAQLPEGDLVVAPGGAEGDVLDHELRQAGRLGQLVRLGHVAFTLGPDMVELGHDLDHLSSPPVKTGVSGPGWTGGGIVVVFRKKVNVSPVL